MFNEYKLKYKKNIIICKMLWKLSFFELKSHAHASRQLATPNYWSPNSCSLQLASEGLKIFLNLN